MRLLFKILAIVGFAIAVMMVHLTVGNLLPFPFHTINVTFVVLIWLIIVTGRVQILWLAVPLSFLLELFSANPFGVNLVAMVGSLSLVAWLLLHTFTNRSIYIVFSAGLICLISYKLFFEILLLLVRIFTRVNDPLQFSWSVHLFWSTGMTAATLTVVYYISSLFTKQLRPEYISFKKMV